jgi:nicotinamidase-related amidase
MTSAHIRDPLADHLITPQNAALVLIDYQPTEDIEFLEAVRATGRRKLVFCALWTEVCMASTALDALCEGYEVYPVVDAIGGTSLEAHRAGLDRVVRAGGQPISLTDRLRKE